MRLRSPGPLLDDQERLSVVVTELLRFDAEVDLAAHASVREVLSLLLNDPALGDGDRRLLQTVLSVQV